MQAALADTDDSAARRRENQAWRIWSLMLARERAEAQKVSGAGDSAVDPNDDADSELGGDSARLASPSTSMGHAGGHVTWAQLPVVPSTPSPGRAGAGCHL